MKDELSQMGRTGILILAFFVSAPMASAEYYVHLDYDWEGDDANEQDPPPKFESCAACHGEKHPGTPKVCEDCHLPDGAGPYKAEGDFVLRADYDVPLVYEHYYDAGEMNVDNQSRGIALSSCFSFGPLVGGTCHGVSHAYQDGAGGHFAFNENWTEEDMERDPYEYTAPSSFLPDTTDCIFCHGQDDEQIRFVWGDATQINSTHSAAVNEECYNCHVENGIKPSSFHSQGLYRVAGEQSKPTLGKNMIVGFIFICVFLMYLLRRIKGGRK